MAPSSTSTLPDTTVTAGRGINNNSVSSSITRQQFRQQARSLRAQTQNLRGQMHARARLLLTRSLLHTYCFRRCEGNRWKNERGEKKGKAPQKIGNARWTRPVSNRRSSDRCNVFTKQTSDADVREMKMVT